jgi:hypothetical protein
MTARQPVSIICVFNDPEVRRVCLDASIEALRAEAPEVDYVPVDNVDGQFSSAGAALNHGAKLARNDVFVFVHQDVYLHSLRALEEAAAKLEATRVGILGAVGIGADSRIIGRMRDRVVLIGESVSAPADVDSLDEVLFMIPRTVLEREPLSEHPDLAWHAYAVEYGLRMRSAGRRSAAIDLPITHNSLTINLAKLDVAHRRIATMYPQLVPMQTTCGTVRTPGSDPGRAPLLASQRWRYRWLKHSAVAYRARRVTGKVPVVLSDLRLDIDDLLEGLDTPLPIMNVDPSGVFGTAGIGELDLPRRGLHVLLDAGSVVEVRERVASLSPADSLLVTNLAVDDIGSLRDRFSHGDFLVGYHEAMSLWALFGPAVHSAPAQWRSAKATPLGLSPLAH